jgi:hypothetical protein
LRTTHNKKQHNNNKKMLVLAMEFSKNKKAHRHSPQGETMHPENGTEKTQTNPDTHPEETTTSKGTHRRKQKPVFN